MKKDGVPFWPDAAWRDVVFAVAVIAGDRASGARRRAARSSASRPTRRPSTPTRSPDWYLLWYFAVFALMPPSLENYVIIGGAARRGRHPLRRAPPLEQGRAERAAAPLGGRQPWCSA